MIRQWILKCGTKAKEGKKRKFDYIKFKNIFFEEHYQESERLPKEWEKIYVNYISGDGLVLRYIKIFTIQ